MKSSDEELSCGSLFQFKIYPVVYVYKISSIRLGFPSWRITFKLGVRQCFNLRWLKLWWMASILDTFRELEKLKNGARRSAAISFQSLLLWWHLHILVTLYIIKRLTWGCTWCTTRIEWKSKTVVYYDVWTRTRACGLYHLLKRWQGRLISSSLKKIYLN